MTPHQKKLITIWTITAIFIILFSLAGYAFFTNPNDRQPTFDPAQTTRTIAQVIASRQSWDPEFLSWFNQPADDMTVKDITGKDHSLTDYRGKNVLVVFWATWCPSCNMEIPHLIKLRDMYPPEKLRILAVSNEPVDILKPFVRAKGINYTVATFTGPLPPPFDNVRGIPTSFFIDPHGKLKLAAVGLVPLQDSIDIINAE